MSQTNGEKMRNVGGNRGFVFVWQEAIGGRGDGKDVGMKLYILKQFGSRRYGLEQERTNVGRPAQVQGRTTGMGRMHE